MNEHPDKDIYLNNWDHLRDELAKLDLLLHLGVLKFRKSLSEGPQVAFKGLCLSDQEISDILQEQHPSSEKQNSKAENDAPIKNLVNAIKQAQGIISQKKQNSLARGIYLALPQLSHLFGLSAFEERTVLICLAPELDHRQEEPVTKQGIDQQRINQDSRVHCCCDQCEQQKMKYGRLRISHIFSPTCR